jgi:hypothetical protein
MLLPSLGGTPSVWNTCILFFQGMLLVGYLYSHGLIRLSMRAQGFVHIIVFTIAIALLPGSPGAWVPPNDVPTALWVLGKLLIYVGFPFAVLSSSAPLLQHWFGSLGRPGSGDPYFLYAASNAGSLMALLAFPTILERWLTIPEQMSIWRWSYVLLAIGIFACLVVTRQKDSRAPTVVSDRVESPSRRNILAWVVLAFVPSSLMLGVTTHITTDIAAVSYLWVMPLGFYLATFIIAFSNYRTFAVRVCQAALPIAALVTLLLVLDGGDAPILLVPAQLAIVSCVSLIIHTKLYEARPQRSDLTLFYLWIAFGGFLGGLFNGLFAPLLFPDVIEYPLVLTLGVLIAEWPVLRQVLQISSSAYWNGFRSRDLLMAVGFSVLFAFWTLGTDDLRKTVLVAFLVSVSSVASAYAVGARTAGRIVVQLCFLSYLAVSITPVFDRGLYVNRSFFGTFRVNDSNDQGVDMRLLVHGTTVHGIQAKDPALALTVQGYYKTVAPVLKRYLESREPASIAVTGLGAGTLACVGRVGDQVTFYEIDASIEQVAREYFTYLDRCSAESKVVIGDARQTLDRVGNGTYDLLILDAFSSDSVPVHLLTDEAAALYDRVTKEDGLMAFHISNRYLDLRPVLSSLAMHRGWEAWELSNDNDSNDPLILQSNFVLISKTGLVSRLLDGVDGAAPLAKPVHFRIWTDDYSNLLAILRW